MTAHQTTRERLKDLRHIGQEMGLCNVVLEHPSVYLECLDVRTEHFSEPLFRLLWAKIQEANESRVQGAPAPTIASILHGRDPEIVRLADEAYGGYPALRRDFIELKCRPEHAVMFRDRVLTMAYQRAMVAGTAALAQQVADMASNTEPKVEAMQDAIEKQMAGILQRTTAGNGRQGGPLAEKDPDVWVQEQQALVASEGEISSLETGMPHFDAYEILQPGRVTCWLVEYKGGKSTIGVNMAVRLGVGARMASQRDVDEHKAQDLGDWMFFTGQDGRNLRPHAVTIIDLEMDKERDVQPRMLSLLSGVPVRSITSRRYLRYESDLRRVKEAYRILRDTGIQFWHPPGADYDLRWIRNVVRETCYRNGTDVLILDYLRPPPGMEKNESHGFEAALADTVKQLTNELKLVTITFAQLNREGVRAKKARSFGFFRPSSSDIQGNVKVNNFVDTMLVQDDHADDAQIKRWWVDHSRITEKSIREYMRVEPAFSYSLMDVTGIESLSDKEDERPRRARRQAPAAAPPFQVDPDSMPSPLAGGPLEDYEGEQLALVGHGYGHDVPF